MTNLKEYVTIGSGTRAPRRWHPLRAPRRHSLSVLHCRVQETACAPDPPANCTCTSCSRARALWKTRQVQPEYFPGPYVAAAKTTSGYGAGLCCGTYFDTVGSRSGRLRASWRTHKALDRSLGQTVRRLCLRPARRPWEDD